MASFLFLKQVFTLDVIKKTALSLFFFSLFISSSNFAQVPMIRLKMHGLPNYLDETVLYYQTGATDGFDSEYDAYKIAGPNSVPQISQEYNSLLMTINGVSPVTSTFSINIRTTTNTTGNFTITASDFNFLPIGSCVKLNDLITGASVNILAAPYVFNLSNTTTTSRFVLTITHYDLPVTSELTQPTCMLVNGGKFKISGNTEAPWNYIWKDSTGAIIQTSQASLSSDSLTGLSNGNYTVEITSVNNCYSNISSFTINEKITPAISFSSPDTLFASIMQNFLPSNSSVNCDSYSWVFGDGYGISNDFEPAYAYSSPGFYEVKLTGTNLTGCADSTTKIISVIDLATSIKTIDKQNIKLLTIGDNSYMVKMNSVTMEEMDINLYNMEGKTILKEHIGNLNNSDHFNLNLNNFDRGTYILNISSKNNVLLNSKLLVL